MYDPFLFLFISVFLFAVRSLQSLRPFCFSKAGGAKRGLAGLGEAEIDPSAGHGEVSEPGRIAEEKIFGKKN